MSKYEARIKKQDDSFYALIVRIDSDGQEYVISGYSRFFKTLKTAEKSSSNYISKYLKG